MKYFKAMPAILFFLAASTEVRAVPTLVDFEDLSWGVSVGDHYASLGLSFIDASAGRASNRHGPYPGASGDTALIHSVNGADPEPSAPISILFTDHAATRVTLTGVSVGGEGWYLKAYNALEGGQLLAAAEAFGPHVGLGKFYPLSVEAAGTRRVEFSAVHSFMREWVVFDNLEFETTAIAIPEPGTLGLMGLALIGLGLRRGKASTLLER